MKEVQGLHRRTFSIGSREISGRKRGALLLLPVLLAVAAVWIWWGNRTIQLTRLAVESHRLPAAFEGFTIAQVSDLHNASFAGGQEKLLGLLRDARPDIIAVTGDLIDANHSDPKAVLAFAKGAVEIADVYYVTGNHEAWYAGYSDLEEQLKQAGVTVLRDEAFSLRREGQSVRLVGLDDPAFSRESRLLGEQSVAWEAKLRQLTQGEEYTILLSHRPEMFDSYRSCGVDLVLSGHAHGGQVRIPFLGGLVAPDQGIFPRYTAGLYREEETGMVVSRGLGNSVVPIRINNRPELVLVTLRDGRNGQ